jgi:ATP-binding cassette subfamily B (MDR/TAP) protein 1
LKFFFHKILIFIRFGRLFVAAGQFVGGVVIAFTKNWKLSLVTLSILPLMMVSGYYMAATSAQINAATHTWYAQAAGVVEEVLLAFRTVVAFGGERREVARYNTALTPARKGGIKIAFQLGMIMGTLFATFALAYALSLWFGAEVLVKNEGISGGTVMTVFYAIIIGVRAFISVAEPFRAALEGRVCGAKVIDTVKRVSEIEPKPERKTDGASAGGAAAGEEISQEAPQWFDELHTIEFRDVVFKYPSRPDVPILKGLNLTIKAGQKCAFVGESGSGKSTAIQLLERFYDPDQGEVFVNGRNLKEMPVLAWRKLIGYVGQEPFVFASSIKENIKAGEMYDDEEILQAADWAQLKNLIFFKIEGSKK